MKQYVVTEEEFMSLIESLELEKFKLLSEPSRFIGADGKPSVTGLHKAFHYRVVSWVQNMGFKAHRG